MSVIAYVVYHIFFIFAILHEIYIKKMFLELNSQFPETQDKGRAGIIYAIRHNRNVSPRAQQWTLQTRSRLEY